MRRPALILAAFLMLGPAAAQSNKPPASFSRDDLQRVETERDAALKRLKALEGQGARADRDAADVDRDLLAAAADSQRREESATKSEARLADLETQAAAAREKLTGDKAALDDLLAALMTLGSRRPPALAASPENTGDAIRAAILMGDAAPALSARAKALAAAIDQLNAAAEGIRREKTALALTDQALTARRQEIEALASEKRLTRASLAAETASLKAETDRLGREADTLRDLLDGLAANAPALPSAKPQPGKQEPGKPQSGKPQSGKPQSGRPQSGNPQSGQAASASSAPKTLAGARPSDLPSAGLAAAPRPAASRAAAPVAPAVGRRVRRFGEKIDGSASPGVEIATRAGAQVIAPLDARVEYAGVFRSYGQMLILDVGGDILVVVSGLDALYPEAGQWVLAGEPIGRMADQKTPSPELYLEVRRNGQPIDPEKWLGRGA